MATAGCLWMHNYTNKMSEPHQRQQSGKLRKSARRSVLAVHKEYKQQPKDPKPGVLNAKLLSSSNADEEEDIYLQTPCRLCKLRIDILKQVAEGYGITDPKAVDPDWRQTWNIGSWAIGSDVSLSINVIQPNIAGCWVGVTNVRREILDLKAENYMAYNLQSSKCTIVSNSSDVQVQGRWSLDLANSLIEEGIANENQIKITGGLNICQSKIFCWVLVSDRSTYMCNLTKESVSIISKYIPDWAADIEETNASGSISIKIKSEQNDATQLILSSNGAVQYQGSSRYLTQLPNALSTAIRNMVKSIHLAAFIDSLEYTLCKDLQLEL